jgi:hypothetical protein
VTTWHPQAPQLIETQLMGGTSGFTQWKNLSHDWQPRTK